MGPRVADLMTKDVVVVDQDAELHELERLFLARRIHGAPVVDAAGRLVGVVSQTDLLAWHFELGLDGVSFNEASDDQMRARSKKLRLSDIQTGSVREVMTPLVHAIRPENSAAEAAARMIRHGIHRLVVVDENLKVLGIISAMDLLPLVPGLKQINSVSEEQ